MATASPIIDFNSWNVADLQNYLKERGVSYSKSRKVDLVELCNLARENNLETDPNCFNDNIQGDIKKELLYDGQVIPDPSLVNGFTADLSGIPPLNNFDVYYDYLKGLDVYPSSQLRDFKNLFSAIWPLLVSGLSLPQQVTTTNQLGKQGWDQDREK